MHLRFESGARRGESVTPAGGQLVFGRDATCHVVLDDDQVSRRHAAVTPLPDGRLRVEDLGSANGTWVAGARLSGPRTLRGGDDLRIGDTVFSVSGSPPRRSRARRAAPVAGLLAAVAALVGAAILLAGGDDDRPAATGRSAAPDMDRLNRATVLLATSVDGRRTNVASGWVLDADRGLVVTNAHLLHLQRRTGRISVEVIAGGRRQDARPVGVAPCEDLAVLQVRAPALGELDLADPGTVGEGDDVVAAGFPFSGAPARNVVATQARVVSAGGPAPGPHGPDVAPLRDVLQLETSLRPGHSGGPVVDAHTRVVGVVAATGAEQPEATTVAVTAGRARPVLADLRRGRSRGWLGAALDPGRGGLALTATVPDGVADRAGLGSGPWILERWDGRRVGDDMTGYCRAAAAGRSGGRVRLAVRPAVEGADGYRAAPGSARRVVTAAYE